MTVHGGGSKGNSGAKMGEYPCTARKDFQGKIDVVGVGKALCRMAP